MRLNLGCGDNRLPPPWQNHDADVDITEPLPWPDDSAQFIVIEHCVEHVSYYEAIEFFKECYRVLKIGGVLRVTVPSLTQVMNCGDQEYFDWLHAKGWAPTADDRGAMHAMLYCHGHKTAWNALLMEATLYYCGFNSPRKQKLNWSSHPDLCGVEGHAKVIGAKFNAIESITFEAAKMTGDLAKDYDERFYAMHVPWKGEYDSMAELIANELPHGSVVDFGCGNGYLVEALTRMGKQTHGIDGSPNVLKYNPSIEVADITKPLDVAQRDLVICTEVAEHVEEQFADVLVDNLCRAAGNYIFFSAAVAGHGGHLHVNEQPREYWLVKFQTRGFELDQGATDRIAAGLRVTNKKTWWFAQNCFVLRRALRGAPLLMNQVVMDESDGEWLPVVTPRSTLVNNKVVWSEPEAKGGYISAPKDQMTLIEALTPDAGHPPIRSTTIDHAVSWTAPKRKVAVVIGGSERVWDDFRVASLFCSENGLEPEYYATNDMIEHFHLPCVACTLHPDKLRQWLPARANAGHPAPIAVWSHDGGSKRNYPLVTNQLRDWGGSVGLFAYQVARERGHDRVILCGVPMTTEKHFLRKSAWSACSVFLKSWTARHHEMHPHVRSTSGGYTEELFGRPTPEWVGVTVEQGTAA